MFEGLPLFVELVIFVLVPLAQSLHVHKPKFNADFGAHAAETRLQNLSFSTHGFVRVRLRRGRSLATSGPHGRTPKTLLQTSTALGLGKRQHPRENHLFGSLYVGVPAQKFDVAFDTGSGNLIIPSAICQTAACLAHRRYDRELSGKAQEIASLDDLSTAPKPTGPRDTIELTVGAGNAIGQLTSDRVCLGEGGSICAQTAFVEATSMSDEPFGVLPYDGVLGLGMPGVSIRKRFNFLGNLAENGVMELDRFAVWLAADGDEEDSEIVFGALDEARIGAGDVMWQRVARPELGLWQLEMKDIALDHSSMNACSTNRCWAALDTSTEVVGGPREIMDALITDLNIQTDCSNYDQLPLLGFVFDEFVLNLEPSDYVKRSHRGCFHQLAAIDVPPPHGPIFLLGEPFLRRYYAVFDRPTLKIGIALARHKLSGNDEKTLTRLVQRPANGSVDDD